MYTITVSVESLTREGVQVIHDNLLKTFAEMRCNDFCIEIAEQSVEEFDAEITEVGMAEESAEEAYIKAFEGFPEEVDHDIEMNSSGDFWVHVS